MQDYQQYLSDLEEATAIMNTLNLLLQSLYLVQGIQKRNRVLVWPLIHLFQGNVSSPVEKLLIPFFPVVCPFIVLQRIHENVCFKNMKEVHQQQHV